MPTEAHTIVLFQVGDRYIGLPIDAVIEVQAMVAMRALPGAPPIVEGIVDLRGRLVAVLDLRSRFGIPHAAPRLDELLVFAHAGPRVVAFRVDRALGISHVPEGNEQTVTSLGLGAQLVDGIARIDGHVVLVHDPGHFLSAEEHAKLGRSTDG